MMIGTQFIDPVFDAREAFKDRTKETELYFGFLKNMLDSTESKKMSSDLRNTLMSVGYLVLYNLIESTARSYINLIHHKMISERIAIEETTELIRKIVLNGFRKYGCSDDFVSQLSDLRIQIMNECYKEDELFSGNVDARLMRDMGKKYGFVAPAKCDELLEVKKNRNDLAHGRVSFVECSKNLAEESIFNTKDKVIRYLEGPAKSIEAFISNKGYRHNHEG